MTLNEIALACGRRVTLEPEHWAWATMLGEARRLSNEGRRAETSDRDPEGNRDVDLLGALAELFLLRLALRAGDTKAAGYVRAHIYNKEGGAGVRGPDLEFEDSATGRLVRIDAKSYRCSPRNRYFAINADKHDALRGLCNYYFCIAAWRYGRQFRTARLVPYDDVSSWARRNLRASSGGSPSCNLPIDTFDRRYVDPQCGFDTLCGDAPFKQAEVERACGDEQVRLAFNAMLPSWPD